MTNATNIANDIRTYAGFMSDGAARSLRLLREIDNTVTAMRTIVTLGDSFCSTLKDMTADVARAIGPIPEYDLIPAYEALQRELADLYRMLQTMHAAAARDDQLRADDGVCDACAAAIKTIADLHECIETLHWRLLEHNADQDAPSGPVLTSAEDIERYLAAL